MQQIKKKRKNILILFTINISTTEIPFVSTIDICRICVRNRNCSLFVEIALSPNSSFSSNYGNDVFILHIIIINANDKF